MKIRYKIFLYLSHNGRHFIISSQVLCVQIPSFPTPSVALSSKPTGNKYKSDFHKKHKQRSRAPGQWRWKNKPATELP